MSTRRDFLSGFAGAGLSVAAGAPVPQFAPDAEVFPARMMKEYMRMVDAEEQDLVHRLPVRLQSFQCPWTECEVLGFLLDWAAAPSAVLTAFSSSFGVQGTEKNLLLSLEDGQLYSFQHRQYPVVHVLHEGQRAWLDLDGDLFGGVISVELAVQRRA